MTPPDDDPQAGRAAWRVIAPLVLVSALLALLGVVSADLLSAARAYVGGESLWSKARVQASGHLRDHLTLGDPAALRKFERSLAVPLGDRRARIELDRPDPDLAVVRDGFIAGGNHPDDVGSMVRLYRWLGSLPPIARAIAVWAAADADIALMAALAAEIEQAGPAPGHERRAAWLARLEVLDDRLAAHELEFSRRLGEASRLSTGVVVGATLALALALSAMAGLFAWRSLGRIEASERAQRESNARWELAAEAARIGLFEWNLPSGRLAVDARCLALHGLPADAPRVQRIRALFRCIHPDDRARVLQANRVGLAGHELWRVRFRVWRGEDGGWRHLELNARRNREAPTVVGLVRDVSDDELAAQLRRDKEAAEQASAAKTAFLSRASHELRTPLNAVLGFAQMMELDRDEPLGPAQQRRLAFVRQGGEHLLRLVNDILDLASAEQGGVGVTLGAVDLGAALRSVAGLLEPLARARRVMLHLAAAAIEVRADRTRLEQVLVNLVSNAIKYNRPGGHVWLTVEPGFAGGWAVASVRDDGVGMTDEQLRGLFQPFNRLGAERSAVEGAGLGLVVSRSLIERFGGQLEVESRPREGTTMRVRLPLA